MYARLTNELYAYVEQASYNTYHAKQYDRLIRSIVKSDNPETDAHINDLVTVAQHRYELGDEYNTRLFLYHACKNAGLRP